MALPKCGIPKMTNNRCLSEVCINLGIMCIIADISYGVIMASSKVCTFALSVLCFALLIESSKWLQKTNICRRLSSRLPHLHFISIHFSYFCTFRLCNQVLPVFVGHKSKMCWFEWLQYQTNGKILRRFYWKPTVVYHKTEKA